MENETSRWIANEEERAAKSIQRVREAAEQELRAIPVKKEGELVSARRIEFKAMYDDELQIALKFLLERGKINSDEADEARKNGTIRIFEGLVINERGRQETHLFKFKYAREVFKYEKKVDADGRIISWGKVPCEISDKDCMEKLEKLPGYEDLGLKPEKSERAGNS
ncbi:hypothetical protein KGQ34_00735 [Patescibacteria group bacterium]|nr:hypothetical protein [Patescibacteria group bacterium]